MRILHCLHNYHPARGGAEWLMQNISERLAAGGHEVTVLTANAWSVEDFFLLNRGRGLMPPGVETVNGVRVRRVPFSRRGARLLILARAAARRLPFPGGNRLRMLSWGPRSRAYARAAVEEAARADLVVACPLPTLNVYYAWKAAQRLSRPFVVAPCFHTEDRATYHNPLYYRWMRSAAGVAALTEQEKEFLEREAGLPAEKIYVTGAGIDLAQRPVPEAGWAREKYSLPSGEIVLFVGQHGLHKGLKDLIKAMSLVWDAGGDASLVIAGNPTAHTREVEKLAAEMEAEKRRRVVILKQFPEEDKRGILRTASVFVSVSPFESFGIVFLEAWREGLPVIGCARGASSRVIEEYGDGLLVQPGQPRELAGALLALLGDPETRRRMGARGRKKVEEQYVWEKIMENWERLYSDAAVAGKTGRRKGGMKL